MSMLPAELADPWPAQDIGSTDALAMQIRDCMATGVARSGLMVALSRLPATQARPTHLRLARAALTPLASLNRARLYHLPDETLMVIWRGDGGGAVAQTMRLLGQLLVEGSAQIGSVADLAEVKYLPQDGPALLRLLHRTEAATPKTPARPGVAPRDLDGATLRRLEHGLAGTNVARFVRRHQIWQMVEDSMSLRWEERYLSVAELAETLEPGLLPKAEPWLFRRLTRSLDGRMLALLASIQELAEAGPFSLNINAASILGLPFLRFDGILPARLRGEVVLELQAADMMADPALFLFARNFARARRYRLLLRGLTPELLDVFRLERLEMDYLRLDWAADLPDSAARVQAADPSRILLCDADDEDALIWGQSMGIQLYQGQAAERRALD